VESVVSRTHLVVPDPHRRLFRPVTDVRVGSPLTLQLNKVAPDSADLKRVPTVFCVSEGGPSRRTSAFFRKSRSIRSRRTSTSIPFSRAPIGPSQRFFRHLTANAFRPCATQFDSVASTIPNSRRSRPPGLPDTTEQARPPPPRYSDVYFLRGCTHEAHSPF
jgi:hypothetical protein